MSDSDFILIVRLYADGIRIRTSREDENSLNHLTLYRFILRIKQEDVRIIL